MYACLLELTATISTCNKENNSHGVSNTGEAEVVSPSPVSDSAAPSGNLRCIFH